MLLLFAPVATADTINYRAAGETRLSHELGLSASDRLRYVYSFPQSGGSTFWSGYNQVPYLVKSFCATRFIRAATVGRVGASNLRRLSGRRRNCRSPHFD